MKSIIFLLFSVLLSASMVSCDKPDPVMGSLSIIPRPNDMLEGSGFFTLNKAIKVSVENQEQFRIAKFLFSSIPENSKWKPEIAFRQNEADIVFSSDTILAEEGYVLDVKTNAIGIRAKSGSGFFYAVQSLNQMAPVAIYSDQLEDIDQWDFPVVRIEDEPSFGWRGFMLDVSRHFFEVEKVKEVLDFMAAIKLNRFHWHLADDQGWRVEIKNYPKLTEIGAWRMDYNNRDETISDWWGRPVQIAGEKATYGGFYTQEEIRDIVKYAKERFIEVIPEIDMPGHAQATIAAYPEIGCVNASQFVATGGVFKNNTYNPGKEETYMFAEKMLNEIMDLFPFRYIHIGGDECNKEQWKIDPHAQQKMKEENLANEEELQSYFIKRIEKIINARERIMIGWDEILEGGLAPNAVVMSWRGETGGINSAKAGHEVIMTPSKYCYLDLKQGHDDLEPNLGYSQALLSSVYNYQVLPESLTPAEGQLIKGIQGNLWTESISDWGKLTYMTFPRIYAIAENAWTRQNNKDWNSFTDRLLHQFELLNTKNIRYAVSAFSPWIHHKGMGDKIEISFTTEVDNLPIYCTLDGTEPTMADSLYSIPFVIEKSAQVRARAIKDSKNVGYVSTMDFPIHKAANATIADEEGKTYPELADLNYARLHPGDSNWVKFSNDISLTVDLKQLTLVQEVSLNSLRYTISGIYPPAKIEIWGSENGRNFTLLGSEDLQETSLKQGRNKVKCKVDFVPTKVAFIKVKAFNHSLLPDHHHRGGEASTMRIDEMVVF